MQEESTSIPGLEVLDINTNQSRGINPEAKVYKSGRLAFNKAAVEMMGLERGQHLELYRMEDENWVERFFIRLLKEPTAHSKAVTSGSDMVYLSLGGFFNAAELDYRTYEYTFGVFPAQGEYFELRFDLERER